MVDVQSKVSRFHGLRSTNPEKQLVAQQVESGCEMVLLQVGWVAYPPRCIAVGAAGGPTALAPSHRLGACGCGVKEAAGAWLGWISRVTGTAAAGHGVWVWAGWVMSCFYLPACTALPQCRELEKAIVTACEDPQRYNLTSEELSIRKRWVDNTVQQVWWGEARLRD